MPAAARGSEHVAAATENSPFRPYVALESEVVATAFAFQRSLTLVSGRKLERVWEKVEEKLKELGDTKDALRAGIVDEEPSTEREKTVHDVKCFSIRKTGEMLDWITGIMDDALEVIASSGVEDGISSLIEGLDIFVKGQTRRMLGNDITSESEGEDSDGEDSEGEDSEEEDPEGEDSEWQNSESENLELEMTDAE